MSPTNSPIYDTHFAHTLAVAMNDFHAALTKRWREKYVDAIKNDDYDYPTYIVREGSPTDQQLWDAHTKAARCHIVFGDCKYIKWVDGGQKGPLSAVRCEGDTGTNGKTVEVPGTPADGGGLVKVPPHIRCGIGDNLKLIDQWAYGERDAIYFKMPLFDAHDQHKLQEAHDALLTAGRRLGLNRTPTQAAQPGFQPADDNDLINIVNSLSGERDQDNDFWAGWTGLGADHAKDGFFKTCVPTFDNQSLIIGSVANLYAMRGAIIQKCRNNTLYSAQSATKACGETAVTKTDLREFWDDLGGLGAAVGVYSAVETAGIGGVVGASLSLAGWLGGKLFPSTSTISYTEEVEEIVRTLSGKIDELKTKLAEMEEAYLQKVKQLRATIDSIKSADLELFDLTGKNPEGDHAKPGKGGGYTANVDTILGISKACFDAGNAYDGVTTLVNETDDADQDLAGEDGSHTEGDKALIDVRNQLKGFLSTTTGRYIVAAREVEKAAKSYSATEDDQRDAFNRIMSDWRKDHIGEVHVHGDPNDLARATDRH
ncbi:hypothetical protein FPZ12_001890 [Amycolatopsis acidicola]|uniref:Uncharacterized protein n=1 Tax=Amycolatopsis acidicola TaxID=2596893 RepID=A0A5N0VMD5_9PSEU|nr:hypothetical protein [Amycolatopsis acidicola]KAA9166340.1 hypothetical protein FPZ12_001890 [Amycolatopsis acidicola]